MLDFWYLYCNADKYTNILAIIYEFSVSNNIYHNTLSFYSDLNLEGNTMKIHVNKAKFYESIKSEVINARRFVKEMIKHDSGVKINH